MGTSNPAVMETVPSRKTPPTVKRQRRSSALKRQIVEETLAPGASVARVARAHGVNANQVFLWRRLYQQGKLAGRRSEAAGLLAVRVAEAPCTPEPALGTRAGMHVRDAETRRPSLGMIQVELPKGKLRLTGCVNRETLQLLLEALLR